MLWSSESWSDSYLLIKNGTKSHHDTNELTNSTFCKSALVWFVASVGREVKGLTELLLSRHFSDILIFWKIFKLYDAQMLTFWAKQRQYLLSTAELVAYPISYQSFCVEILDPEVVLGQYFKPMTCQVEAEWDCYMPTIYRLTLQLTSIYVIQLYLITSSGGPSTYIIYVYELLQFIEFKKMCL